MNCTSLRSVRNWKTIPQSWKLCGAGTLSRAGATSKDSSFVRMTKLETEYTAYFYVFALGIATERMQASEVKWKLSLIVAL